MEVDERREQLELAEAQREASSTIYGSNDPVEILNALVSFGGKVFAEAHLALLSPTPLTLDVIAVRDASGLHAAQTQRRLDEYPAYETLSAVETLYVADADSDPFLTPPERERLQAQGSRALLVIPLVVAQRLTGLIGFSSPEPVELTPHRLRAMRSLGDQIAVVFENQALLRDAQQNAQQLAQQVQVLQGLNRLTTGLSSFASEKELLDYAAHILVEALNVDHVGIALFEPREDKGMVVSEYPDHGAVGSQVEARNSPMMDVLHAAPDQPLVIDVATNPLVEASRAVLQRVGVVSLMVIALRTSGQTVGTVGFDLYDPARTFTSTMIATAQTMVAQIAIALQNIRLLTDAQRRADQLQRIAAFGQSVQATLNLDMILNIMLIASREMIPMDQMQITLYDLRLGQLRLVAQYDGTNNLVDLDNGAIIPLEGTAIGQAWQTQELVMVDDTQARVSPAKAEAESGLRSLLVALIRSRGRQLGTVSIGSLRPYSYSETDQAIFQQMINGLAVAIENAEAYTQSQRVAQNAALINEIATHLQQHSALEDMLQITISELGAALGARRGRLQLSLSAERGNQP